MAIKTRLYCTCHVTPVHKTTEPTRLHIYKHYQTTHLNITFMTGRLYNKWYTHRCCTIINQHAL